MSGFAQRLVSAVQTKRNAVLVGLDPRFESLPESLRPQLSSNPREDAAQKAAAYLKFCQGVIDVVAPLVPAVKPQAAFFEELGPAGMNALYEVIAYARSRGLLVVLDGKRNDIGSTATAYAHGYLGPESNWQADALTVSPYLGDDSLTPFVEVAQQTGTGIFVLVKTSNPGGGKFQDLVHQGAKATETNPQTLYQHVAEYVQQLALSDADASGYGSIGAVVGATYPEQLTQLRAAMPNALLLIPGFGSQGGTAKDVASAFDAKGLGAIINNSRGIIFAHSQKRYADKFTPAQWQQAVEAATVDMIEQLRAETSASCL